MIKFPGEQKDRKIQIIVGLFIIILAGMGINKIWGQQDAVELVSSPEAGVTSNADEAMPKTQGQGEAKPGMDLSNQNNPEDNQKTDQQEEVVVYITGAVEKPGIVRLPAGSRLYEALAQAVLREDAAQDYLNPAEIVQDGQKYYVPNHVQAAQWAEKDQQDMSNFQKLMDNSAAGKSAAGGSTTTGKININTASTAQLEELNGVGPALANAIVKYREQKGKFKRVDELKNVPGIGDKKFEQMKDQIRI